MNRIRRWLPASCATQACVGWAVVPMTRTRLLARWMTARMYLRCPVKVTDFEEVHRQDRLGLGTQEARPGDLCPLRSRIDTGGREDLPDGRGGNRNAKQGKFTVDAP